VFTGIIERQGRVLKFATEVHGRCLHLGVTSDDFKIGESVAINGVCLTYTLGEQHSACFNISPETLNCTNLGELKIDDYVNIERAVIASERFGAHYVSGHVNTTANLLDLRPMGEYLEIIVGDFGLSADRYLMPKGNITLDGVGLTINRVDYGIISVMLIPHTLAQTTFKQLTIGRRFNVEFDYLAQIIAHQLSLNSFKLSGYSHVNIKSTG